LKIELLHQKLDLLRETEVSELIQSSGDWKRGFPERWLSRLTQIQPDESCPLRALRHQGEQAFEQRRRRRRATRHIQVDRDRRRDAARQA